MANGAAKYCDTDGAFELQKADGAQSFGVMALAEERCRIEPEVVDGGRGVVPFALRGCSDS